jgi:hypothetical protein
MRAEPLRTQADQIGVASGRWRAALLDGRNSPEMVLAAARRAPDRAAGRPRFDHRPVIPLPDDGCRRQLAETADAAAFRLSQRRSWSTSALRKVSSRNRDYVSGLYRELTHLHRHPVFEDVAVGT